MARFFATVVNGRGNSTSVGGRSSVESAHVRGWDVGIEVECLKLTDGDRLDVYMTGGSHAAGGRTHIGSAVLQRGDDAPHFEPSDTLREDIIEARANFNRVHGIISTGE